jgi:hypothetical protein
MRHSEENSSLCKFCSLSSRNPPSIRFRSLCLPVCKLNTDTKPQSYQLRMGVKPGLPSYANIDCGCLETGHEHEHLDLGAEWRQLRNKELQYLLSSRNIIMVIKCKRMRPVGHVARMVDSKTALMKLSPSCAATQELPSILWNPKFHYRVHKSPLSRSLSWVRSIQSIPSSLSQINFNIVHPPTSWSSYSGKLHTNIY